MINKQIYAIIINLILVFYHAASWSVSNSEEESRACVIEHVTVGFFNGVWNTRHDAYENGQIELNKLLKQDTDLSYELFYNDTNGWQDLAEVFIQRADEMDKTGQLSQHFELLWDLIRGKNEESLWHKIAITFPKNLDVIVSKLYEDIKTNFIAAVAKLVANPPTEQNYMAHNDQLDKLAAQGEMLLLVGHSQGNLFLNHAYDYIISKIKPANIKVVHVAPASATLRGEYVLSSNDFVINALRINGFSVPENNIILPISKNDLSGHFFVSTYLDSARSGYNKIKGILESAVKKLKPDEGYTQNGSIIVSITDAKSESLIVTMNVDLHKTEPDEKDNLALTGLLSDSISCNPNSVKIGTYTFSYIDWNGATSFIRTPDNTNAIIKVWWPNQKKPHIRTITLKHSEFIPIVRIHVKEDKNHKYTYTVEDVPI